MRNLGATIASYAAQPTQFRALAMTLETDGETIRVWTGIGDMTYGGEVYQGLGDFIGVGNIEEMSDLTAASVEFVLSGVPGEYVARALTESIRGKIATLDWVWFADGNFTAPVGGIQIYRGRADTYQVDDNGETSRLTLSTENRLIEAQGATNRTWTRDDQRGLVDPDDAFFDSVERIQELDLGQWGREP